MQLRKSRLFLLTHGVQLDNNGVHPRALMISSIQHKNTTPHIDLLPTHHKYELLE